jgi:hypothetical protein
MKKMALLLARRLRLYLPDLWANACWSGKSMLKPGSSVDWAIVPEFRRLPPEDRTTASFAL